MQNTVESQYIKILNKVLDSCKDTPITSLEFLSNESNFKNLLLEIEPAFSSKASEMEISQDDSFGIRYANFVSIFKCIDSYLANHQDREKFTSPQLSKLISFNDVLKKDKVQLVLLCESLIFLLAISSKKETFLEKVSDLDTSTCEAFFSCVEKYLFIDDQLNQSRSVMVDKSFMRQESRNEKYEKEKKDLMNIIKDNENKIFSLKMQIEKLEKEKSKLEETVKDKENEIDFLKQNQTGALENHEQFISTAITNSELNTKLNEKDIEITDLKKEIELINERYKSQIKKLTEDLEVEKDKNAELSSIQQQYNKLNIKYKELHTSSKDVNLKKDDMRLVLGQKDSAISMLKMEKEALAKQVQKLSKENLTLIERAKTMEFDKKKLEFQIVDLKNELNNEPVKEMSFLENKEKTESKTEQSEIGFAMNQILNDTTKINQSNLITAELKRADTNRSGNENIEIFNETIQKLRDENLTLVQENSNLKSRIDKLITDNEKLDMKYQKADVEKEKIILTLERTKNEIKSLQNDNTALNDKLKNFTVGKKKEIDKLKADLTEKTKQIDKVTTEKKTVSQNLQKVTKDFELYKQSISKDRSKTKDKDKDKKEKEKSFIPNSEYISMKNDIQNLSLLLAQKEEIIKKLQESAKSDSGMELTEEEINTKLSDLDFYKKSYEEQKARVNKEHELISDSLYTLAVHFMGIKENLQKNMKKTD